MIAEAGVNLRLHSWFSRALVRDGRAVGVVCDTKSGREATLGDVVIDASGDLDVAWSAGAPFIHGSYILTTVFRLAGVDVAEAERFQWEEPEAYRKLDLAARRTIGGSWEHWWLKTPLPGVVWCNCPHMQGFDGVKVEDLTRADFEGRERIYRMVDFVRAKLPGFKDAFVIDVAPQLGVRQTRLLDGEYVVTKEDVIDRVHFADTVARGRDYYTPYRAMLPQRRRPAAGRRPPLLGDRGRAEAVARDPALHVDGPVGGRRRGARARGPASASATSTRRRSAPRCASRAAIPATGRPPTRACSRPRK